MFAAAHCGLIGSVCCGPADKLIRSTSEAGGGGGGGADQQAACDGRTDARTRAGGGGRGPRAAGNCSTGTISIFYAEFY